MNTYHIFIVSTENYDKIVRMQIKSLKQYKKPQSVYIIHLYLDTERTSYYQEFYKDIENDTFKIEVKSCTPYKDLIKVSVNWMPYTDYVRLLAPRLFPDIDKILVLDSDLFVNSYGLEDFMDENLDDYYVNATMDVPINFDEGAFEKNTKEKQQCQTQAYFNTGVFELNLKKIREDGLDYDIIAAALKFPENLECHFNIQTILNYYLKDKVKISDPKYNNTSLTLLTVYINIMINYIKKWNYKSLDELLAKSVIVHYPGPKPWRNTIEETKQYYPLFNYAIQTFNIFKETLKDEIY